MDAPAEVVVVGAGIAGLAAAKGLHGHGLHVTLLDAENYTTFQPLLFEAATAMLAAEDVVTPVHVLVSRWPDVTFRMGRAEGIDWDNGRVRLNDGDELAFDFLVLAPGVVPAYHHVAGAQRYAIPLKSIGDAILLRNSLLRAFEEAAAHPDRVADGLTSVVIVGGGSSGVEMAGYLADFLIPTLAADHPQLAAAATNITLLELGDRLLPVFDPALSAYAADALRRRGVDLRFNTEVRAVDERGVTLTDGGRLLAATVIWTAGVAVPGWISRSNLPMDGPRVAVGADLRLTAHPETFAVGDLATIRGRNGSPVGQVAQAALQSGRHAARQITRIMAGQPTEPLNYRDKGSMAMVGRYAAVMQSGRLRLTGVLAWIAWGLLHWAFLPGWMNRMSVAQKWRMWHITGRSPSRVLLEAPPEQVPPPRPAGRREPTVETKGR
jgi:NADH:ubiquinone reductase (H+-translocating)